MSDGSQNQKEQLAEALDGSDERNDESRRSRNAA